MKLKSVDSLVVAGRSFHADEGRMRAISIDATIAKHGVCTRAWGSLEPKQVARNGGGPYVFIATDE